MTFFYDLNKRLANLSQQQTLTEGAVAEASYSAKAARAGKDIGKPGKNFEKIAKDAGQRYGSKAAGERVAGAVLNKLRHPKEGVEENVDKVAFAALVPPKDKITFADKIAGAKQEVEEMLGDVAAEAIKSALTPKQKKLDRNNNGKLDAQDFEMLRRGGKQETDEGFPTVAGARADMHKRKVGDVTHGAKHDTEETPTGRRVTRRTDAQGYSVGSETDDEGNVKSTEKRRAGRPKGADKGPERVTAKAYKHKGSRKTNEGDLDITDRGEYDQEGEMAKDDIKTIVRHAQALEKILSDNDNLPEWVQAKLAKIEGMMTAVDDYMQNQEDGDVDLEEGSGEGDDLVKLSKVIASCTTQAQLDTARRMAQNFLKKHQTGDLAFYGNDMKRGMAVSKDIVRKRDEIGGVEEEKTNTRDNRAERAGKKVTKDIEYDEKKKDGIHGKRRGSEDDKAEKAGKKVAKDIEYDEKKGKKKEVEETTTSGAVATGGTAPKAGKGGVQIGKGIYDSLNRELENMISESMSINVSMTSDDNGSHKNITVTAADEDAEILAQLLQRAGLGGGMSHDHGHEEPCPDCGSTDCGCDEAVEEAYGDVAATENKPNWPTDAEYNDDAMQYSGGLNKPKTDVAGDGQTTVPNTAVHTQDEDALRRMMEMAGIQQDLKPWERTMKEDDAVEEGVMDTVKGVVKKGLEKLGHGSDEEMIKDLQKKTGVPQTGKKPEAKEPGKMQESLMREFSNFKI